MHQMQALRGQLWLEETSDWSWPGSRASAAASSAGSAAAELQVELSPPSWVPTRPRLEPALATGGVVSGAGAAVPGQRAAGTRRLASSVMLLALAIACGTLAVESHPALERLLGIASPSVSAPGHPAAAALSGERLTSPPPLPPVRIQPMSQDGAGSAIDAGSFTSRALHGPGSFLVYLPPGFARADRRYPVLYLLHGTDETDSSFLQIGVQGTLDRLIARRTIPPLIAVMIQGGAGTNNWLNHTSARYESYVLETQRLVDRTLPTIPARDGRAIAGYSMGGYGAMHLALAHPQDFTAVESWLGFFNGLDGLARADRSTFSRLTLKAFVYGGQSDAIADPAENAPFAATLRADGASAHSAVYPGEHDFATLEAHLESMLIFAGRSLEAGAGGAGFTDASAGSADASAGSAGAAAGGFQGSSAAAG
jgi:enterochelin esterase-like enzyme